MRDAGIALSRDYYVPGEQLDGQIVVRCDKSFISDGVFVELLGEETSQYTIAEAYYPLEEIHPNLWTQHLFRVESNLPPPFISELMQVGCTLKVTLDIPWGVDEEASIPLRWSG